MCRLSTRSSTTMSGETTGVHATTDRGVMRMPGGLQCGSQLYRCTGDVATVQMKWLLFWNGTALEPPTSQMVPLTEGILFGMTPFWEWPLQRLCDHKPFSLPHRNQTVGLGGIFADAGSPIVQITSAGLPSYPRSLRNWMCI